MTLEDMLREAAAKGLTHLSLHPVHSEDHKTVYWRCTATPSTMHKYVHVTTNDPVEAVTQVLKALPKAGRRPRPVTAAVNPDNGDLSRDAEDFDPAPSAVPDPQPSPENEMEAWLPKT